MNWEKSYFKEILRYQHTKVDYLKDHLISTNITIKEALTILDKQGLIANVLFVADEEGVCCRAV